MARVLLLGTVETKGAALDFLVAHLERKGMKVELIDVSLGTEGAVLAGGKKLARMEARAAEAAIQVTARQKDCAVALGIGGGTGGEIVLEVLRCLPATYPKLLITTLAFDPRAPLADNAITLIPTLCDIEGMNTMLAQVLENAAAMVAGLVQATMIGGTGRMGVALTTLGATGPAGMEISRKLEAAGMESTVFHANGFGGAAFTRFLKEGRAEAVIDLNVHELGRMRLAGAHVPMPERFTAARDLPQVVLPGALNFLGLGAIDELPPPYRARPHYRHSSQFTHVKLSKEEMASQAACLADALNGACAPCHLLLPMGGFSHEDRPGGAIEDPDLRDIAAETLERAASAYQVSRLPHHINTPETADAAVAALVAASRQRKSHA